MFWQAEQAADQLAADQPATQTATQGNEADDDHFYENGGTGDAGFTDDNEVHATVLKVEFHVAGSDACCFAG